MGNHSLSIHIYIEADEILRGLYHVTAARQLLYVPPLCAPISILQSLEGEEDTGTNDLHTLTVCYIGNL